MSDKATFRANFPQALAAIKVSGDGGGMRIQLDIPESDMGEAVKLLLMRQMVVRVTIEPDATETPMQGSNPHADDHLWR